jgi:hypothetical protein
MCGRDAVLRGQSLHRPAQLAGGLPESEKVLIFFTLCHGGAFDGDL